MIELTPENSEILIHTTREGALSPVGHDLCFAASKFVIEIDQETVKGWVEPSSIHVKGAVDNERVNALSSKDADKIEKKMHKDVFNSKGRVEFEGTRTSLTVSYGGRSTDLSVDGQKAALAMSKLGLGPVSAFFGALKVTDVVEIELSTEVGLD